MTKNEILESAINTLSKSNTRYFKLKELGIDLIDFNNDAEKSIIGLCCFIIGKDYTATKDFIEWWLYEGVDKKLYTADSTEKNMVALEDLSNISDFINYLLK